MRKVVFAVLAALFLPHVLFAQAEIVKGRIVADSGNAVYAADVYVTRAPDRLTQLAHTDSLGYFSTRFEHGTGDYLVNVRAIGYKPLRKRITRAGSDSVLVANLTLQTEAVAIAPLIASARRLKPTRDDNGIATQSGSNERIVDGVNGALSPDEAGDINSVAANIPGILPTPAGASALGLPADQNSVLMNGMNFGGSTVPRDARTMTRVSTSSFDPSRGGFSAAQITVDLAPGGQFSSKRGHVSADAPQLQFGDAYARAVGQEYRGLALSAAADGELKRDKWFYNASFQSKNRAADYSSLLSADNSLFTLAGVAPDSAHRLVGALQGIGVPNAPGPSARSNNEYTFLGRIDHTPYGDRAFGLTSYLDVARSSALAISPTVTPSHGGSTQSVTGMLQAIYSFYFARDYLGDVRSALTYHNNTGDPYLRAPAGRVNLASASLGFGGNGMLDMENSSWLWQTTTDLQLYTRANRHKVRVHAESQLELFDQQDPADLFGTYTYQSINDLIANKPAAFSRTLQSQKASGGMWSGVLAIGDNLRKSQNLNVMYGARVEGNHFTDVPAYNPAVQSAFGVRTDAAPNRVHVSPRLGFSWRRGGQFRNYGMTVSNLMTRYLVPSGVLRGGVGEFRGQMSSRLLTDAMRATGLAGGVMQLECVGTAVPVPAWDQYADNPALIPQQCANGAPPVYADASRSVQLVSGNYDAPRSWRANVGWMTKYHKTGVTLDATYSLNLGQPGSYDLNFRNSPRMTLASEGDRPVFVAPASIVAATGVLSPADSRINSAFGRVSELRSDLRSRGTQFTVSLLPEFANWKYYANVSYTLSSSRAQFRGFDGGAFGDPSQVEWAPGNYDARHQFVTQFGRVFKLFDVTLQHRLVSGLPFTPVVDGDVNGDGVGMDRAFITAPLAGSAPGYARDCIDGQVGRAAARNSCRGPWTNSLNVRLQPNQSSINTGARVRFALNLSKSWASVPDPVLYHVRGFDAANQRFTYETNAHFGDTHNSRTIVRNPFRVTLDVSLNLGKPMPQQQLARYLAPGRTSPGEKVSVDSLERRYRRNVTDIYDDILEESDSLLLSKDQVAALKGAQKVYRAQMDSLWHDLAVYLENLPQHFNSAEALKRQEDAVDQGWEITRLESPKIREILSPLQVDLLGGMVRTLMTAKEKLHIRMYRY